MMDRNTELRKFRGGSWDLRRIERRREQLIIGFPDRRKNERRLADQGDDLTSAGMLLWIDPSKVDE